MNTLDILLKHFNWQGGTFYQALDQFKKSPIELQGKICDDLIDNLTNIKDLGNLQSILKIQLLSKYKSL